MMEKHNRTDLLHDKRKIKTKGDLMSAKYDEDFYKDINGITSPSFYDFIYEIDADEIIDIYLGTGDAELWFETIAGDNGYIVGDWSSLILVMKFIEKQQYEKSLFIQKYLKQKAISKTQHQELLRLEAKCENLEKELKELKKMSK